MAAHEREVTRRSLKIALWLQPRGRAPELDAAVKVARATSHFETAVLLSGGADSSIVAASLVRQRPNSKMRAFSIGYDVSGSEDESEYARRMAESLGMPHEVVRLHARQVPQLLEEVALLTEDPIEDPVTLPTLLLARRVAYFTKVALSGDGSDEFWGGYARFDNPPTSLDEYLLRSMVFEPEELGLKAPPASYLDDVILPAANLSPLRPYSAPRSGQPPAELPPRASR